MTLPKHLQELREYILCEDPDSWEFLDSRRALFKLMEEEK